MSFDLSRRGSSTVHQLVTHRLAAQTRTTDKTDHERRDLQVLLDEFQDVFRKSSCQLRHPGVLLINISRCYPCLPLRHVRGIDCQNPYWMNCSVNWKCFLTNSVSSSHADHLMDLLSSLLRSRMEFSGWFVTGENLTRLL